MSKHMIKSSEQKLPVAISVKNVSKQFFIPHERINSIKIAFINLFRKNTYESFYALKDVSFEVKKGEFFGIIGRNGSGKSTLLKILAGVYTANDGEVEIDGLVSPFLELGIGFNPGLSGRDNIYLNATVLGLCEREIDERFDSIVAFSELERFIDQKIKNYSSGMQVRLAFSVAIHANREILLMDEVLAVGDSNFQSKCLREFARYKEMGKTVVLVTHDISTVQRYCDRAMLLRAGEVAMIGTAEEVGNEYILENMSDEEKRLVKEQEAAKIKAEKEKVSAPKEPEKLKVQLPEEQKNKVAEITSVEFLDKDGKPRNTFETDEMMDIKIDFKVNKEKTPINIGIGMHSPLGTVVFGYNTKIDQHKIIAANNSVTLHFDRLPLLKGEYYINVSCFGDDERSHYDYKLRCKEFKVYSIGKENSYGGMLHIKHEWK